jgi:uncharacterized protein (DUF983 family)
MFQINHRNLKSAILRGLRKSCPACGKGYLFTSYLGVRAECSNCGEDLHHQRADDAPPYFTMMIVGHTVVPLLLLVEKIWRPDLWIHFVIWLPLTLIMTLSLLPRVKGATVGLQWALRMHGFAATPESGEKPVGP